MTAVCSSCQASLEPGALEGLCPRCLLVQAIPLQRVEGVPTSGPAAFVPPSPAELAPLFPQLEILQLLGQGGMGAVYKARQVKLDRLVALKILPPAVARDPGFAERFGREARALAKLNHPHIVAVHDFGDVNGLYFLVMEYVEGVNLRQSLSVGKLEPRQALALVSEICSALAYAHQMGVVHRDIKPENVLLDRQGRVKIADFGLAKLVGQTQSPARLTGTRQAMGTPHYMAPEQWERPLEVDHRADIYSLGVVFYELLTGELPLGKFAPPSAKAGGDPRVDQVVLRAMEKEPAQRYQQMSEMKSAVEQVEQPEAAEPSAPSEVHLNPVFETWVTIGMVAVAAAMSVALGQMPAKQGEVNLDPWLLFCFLLWMFFTDWGNRYLRRALSITFFALAAILLWSQLTQTPHVLVIGGGGSWGLFLLLGGLYPAFSTFMQSFKPGGQRNATIDAPPVPGLTAQEDAVRRLLVRLVEAGDCISAGLSVIPDISSNLLVVARAGCAVPKEERVLGVLNLSDHEEGEEPDRVHPHLLPAIVFGCKGLYWRNGAATPHPGTGTLTNFDIIVRTQFVDHGDAVFLGKDHYLCPDENTTGISAAALAAVMYQLKDALIYQK